MIPPSELELTLLHGIVFPSRREETLSNLQRTSAEALQEGKIRRLLYPFYSELTVEQQRKLPPGDLPLYTEIARQKNEIFHREAIALLQGLASRSIDATVLKGSALRLLFGNQMYLRPQSDIDIAVPMASSEEAFQYLLDSGWRVIDPTDVTPSLKARKAFMHAVAMAKAGRKGMPEVWLDLHWHVLAPCPSAAVDEVFWAKLHPVPGQATAVRVFDPTYQLIYTWAHGSRLSKPPVDQIWVLDTWQILSRSKSAIRWDDLLEFASEFRLRLLFRDLVQFLNREFRFPIPTPVLDELCAGRPSFLEYVERTVQQGDRKKKLLGDVPVMICHFFRLGASSPPGFVEMSRLWWKLPARGGLWRVLFTKAKRRLMAWTTALKP